MKKFLIIFLVIVMVVLIGEKAYGKSKDSKDIARTIKLKATFSTKPEKHVNVFIVEGEVKEYKKKGGLMQPDIEFKEEKGKFLGTTPFTTALIFTHNAGEENYIWHPPNYKVKFASLTSNTEVIFKETSFLAGPYSLKLCEKEFRYKKDFPYNYFIKNPSVTEKEIKFDFCVE